MGKEGMPCDNIAVLAIVVLVLKLRPKIRWIRRSIHKELQGYREFTPVRHSHPKDRTEFDRGNLRMCSANSRDYIYEFTINILHTYNVNPGFDL